MDGESYFINIRLLEDFFDFLRGKVPGTLEIQADSEKNRRKLRENEKSFWEMDRNVVRPVMLQVKVARNEFENASFAQRSAHRDSRIWWPELIEPAAERKRRARARADDDQRSNRPTPTHRFCHSAIFRPITPYNVWFFWVSRHGSIILAKKNRNIFGQILRNSRKCVKTWVIENVHWSEKTPRYSSKQSLECLPEVFLTDEPNTNEKKTATKHQFIALLTREEKNKDVSRQFFVWVPIFDPTLVQYFIQIPHIIFCCPLSAYDKWWFEQNNSPHFREKYLVLSYLKTCQSKALDQSSRGFWYFEHLNLAYRATQMQSLTEIDGLYHTFCSTSSLSTFLFIGPYLRRRGPQTEWKNKEERKRTCHLYRLRHSGEYGFSLDLSASCPTCGLKNEEERKKGRSISIGFFRKGNASFARSFCWLSNLMLEC